ncbi:MAG: hypothetical protein ACOYMG_28705 [Candidatus Methylumidiphilus sp.]
MDDTPEHLKPLAHTLREAGHAMNFARDLGAAWGWLERGDHFDLIAIDLALDRYIREFEAEQAIIREGLALRNLADLPMSGQALGLRLWNQRKTLRQRYCYISNHTQLWLEAADKGGDPEFGGKNLDELSDLLIDKSSLWSKNVADKLKKAYEAWDQQQWLV